MIRYIRKGNKRRDYLEITPEQQLRKDFKPEAIQVVYNEDELCLRKGFQAGHHTQRYWADPGLNLQGIIERKQVKRTAEIEYLKELRRREKEREKAKAERTIAVVEK